MTSTVTDYTDAQKWLRAGEAARLLGITKMGLHKMAGRGEVPYRMAPWGRMYAREDVERLAEARRKPEEADERDGARQAAAARADGGASAGAEE